jgi:hypothetical protein
VISDHPGPSGLRVSAPIVIERRTPAHRPAWAGARHDGPRADPHPFQSSPAPVIALCGPCSPNSKHARSPHVDAAAEVFKVHGGTEVDKGLPDRTARLVLDTDEPRRRHGFRADRHGCRPDRVPVDTAGHNHYSSRER